jgi:hypothetical protein
MRLSLLYREDGAGVGVDQEYELARRRFILLQ